MSGNNKTGQPSLLTERQWAKLEREKAAGKTNRWLATKYGVSASAVQKRCGAQAKVIQDAARTLLEGERLLKSLPISNQIMALDLLDELRATSENLASAAHISSLTSRRCASIAHRQVERIEFDDAGEQIAGVRADVREFQELATEASKLGLGLLAASQRGALQARPPERDATPVDDNPVAASHAYQLLLSGK